MGKKQDLQGRRFGKLVVLKEDGRIGSNVAWICRCDCGNEVRVRSSSLLSGNTTTCGCGRIEAITTHNQTGTRLFNVWRNIKERCENKNYKTYPHYGGRGIRLCDEWHDFEVFERWAKTHGYGQGLTIDRIDVNGNYEPSNCRWVTPKQQARNRRKTVFLEHNGEKRSLAEWAEVLGEKFTTLQWRYYNGWSAEEILFGKT